MRNKKDSISESFLFVYDTRCVSQISWVAKTLRGLKRWVVLTLGARLAWAVAA